MKSNIKDTLNEIRKREAKGESNHEHIELLIQLKELMESDSLGESQSLTETTPCDDSENSDHTAKEVDDQVYSKYLDSGGQHCLHCGSDNIEGGSTNVHGDTANQEVSCNNCETTWVDVFELKSVDLVVIG
jgi:hypothetical protein